mmetsp:Transcript_85680/g.227638  ORF Transcript_85680/g.227638 Transcript_85680/m.227638 type:complete len:324 (+) Transcript_85680:176-1147(+)
MRSSSPTSSSVSWHARAPTFSAACSPFFAPGMGIAPLAMAHASATCAGVRPWRAPISRSLATRGSISRIGYAEKPRRPSGCFLAEYLPVSRPIARGEYARSLTPRPAHSRRRPPESGSCRRMLSSTWLLARGMPREARAACSGRSSSIAKLLTPTALARPASTTSARPCPCSSNGAGKSGAWIWKSASCLIPSRPVDSFAAASMAWRTVRPESRHFPGWNFVAIMSSSRSGCSRTSLPTIFSDSPPPYVSAVSNKRTPLSTAVEKAAAMESIVRPLSYAFHPHTPLSSPHAQHPMPRPPGTMSGPSLAASSTSRPEAIAASFR